MKAIFVLLLGVLCTSASPLPLAKRQSTATSHPTAAPGAWDTFSVSGSAVKYKVYTPSKYSASQSVPLIMMLHGCTQDMNVFSDSTQYAGLAEAQNFIVVFPSQDPNASNKCWKWYDSGSQQRGGGDAAILAGIVDSIKSNGKWAIDSSRTYVGGLSAGAAMAVIMGNTYPDYFAAICSGSGLEYGAAHDLTSGSLATSQGGPSPSTAGQAAFQAEGSHARSVPALVFQGTSDYTVNQLNGDQIVQQYLTTNKLAAPNSGLNTQFGGSGTSITGSSTTADGSVSGGYTYKIFGWNDNSGVNVQYYKINSMGHAWSGGFQTGSATYVDPKGPDASLISYNFFMQYTTSGTTGGNGGSSSSSSTTTTKASTTTTTTSSGGLPTYSWPTGLPTYSLPTFSLPGMPTLA
ncbi:esterase PHB depolymerase-domain-containing protein [Gongronella butleri]|nr:esterase PHB depolymerase-domain-containing protein [Gongronella butleri]